MRPPIAPFVALLLSPPPVMAAPMDTRAPDLVSPTTHLMPAGQSEWVGGLGVASFGTGLTPAPQVWWQAGLSERSDWLVGMMGQGPTLLYRYAMGDRLNLETGVVSTVVPNLGVGPLLEVQADRPLGGLTLHLVGAGQLLYGESPSSAIFGLAGLEGDWQGWTISGSLRLAFNSRFTLDRVTPRWAGNFATLDPAVGARHAGPWGLTWELAATLREGAPAALVLAARRY